MLWDCTKINPFEHPSGGKTIQEGVIKNILHGSRIKQSIKVILRHQSSNDYFLVLKSLFSSTSLNLALAISIPYPCDYFDTLFTDPTYLDNVPYSYLQIFYVWLKKAEGEIHQELSATPLTPNKQLILANSHQEGGIEDGNKLFEENLKKAYKEIHRVLKPDGIAVIVYAQKSTPWWKTLINSL